MNIYTILRYACAIFIIFYINFAIALCPLDCSCSSQSIRCTNIKLTTIPTFTNNVEIIDLRYNHIYDIQNDAFNGQSTLHTIFLNNNQLSSINEASFDGLISLRFLYLQKNQITTIERYSFRGLTNLKYLDLRSNHITAIDKETFSNLPYLRELLLEDNKIRVLPNILNTKHLNLNIHNNPIVCDCSINWLLDALHKRQIRSTVTCKYPDELNGRDLTELTLTDLKCSQFDDTFLEKPVLSIRPHKVIVRQNANIIIHCLAKGKPEPQINWYHDDKLLSQQSNEQSRVYANGTLFIEHASIGDSGVYKCEATNYMGTVSDIASVTVESVTVFPHKIIEKQVKIGGNIAIECDSNGHKILKNIWQKNNINLVGTNRITFSTENYKVHIIDIKESDTGLYSCMSETPIGTIEIITNLTVQQGIAPKIVFEPFDMEVIPGTTIEMPCESEGDPKPRIHWKKDGRTIFESTKYRISNITGSLHIKKITLLEAGRYECTAQSQHGRDTASGVITVTSNDVLSPDRIIRVSYEEASRDIDNAINQTINTLFGKPSDGNNNGKTNNHGDLFKKFRYPNAVTRELARAAEIYERTLVKIRQYVDKGAVMTNNASNFNYTDLLSTEHLNLIAELSGCQAHRLIPNCTNMCFHLKYRSIDGSCNNLQTPSWGASLTGFRRILPPIYENGFSMPVGWTKSKLYHGFPKPSARLVSTTVISTPKITPDEQITHMVMQWGQFLDHDLDHAIPSVSSESWDGIDCKKSCDYSAPCYPIEVPPNDVRIKNRRCIDLVRSSAICGSGMTSVFFDGIQPREQINQHTSFIDASQVYGFAKQFSRDLRNLTSDDGLLRTGVDFPNQKSMLPFAAPTDMMDCRRNIEESSVNCFTAGDIRVNEQIGLAAMHTIWLREHNRLAIELKELNRHWDGETLYQEARKIVGAQMQHITFKHWLPNVIGEKGMEMLGEYKGYDPTVNPSISNEFATAALRFGHTLINPILHRLNETFMPIPQGHLELHKAFFSPWRLVYEGGVDPLLRGMFSVPAKLKMPTENLNTELTEKLFLTSHAVALDLAAINIQRARDHAIPGYNEFRKICNLTWAETFDDLKQEISNQDVRDKLKQLYGHPGNIDLFVGGILEDQIEGARIGPLFRCLLIEQFRNLRNGDRHWYENPSTFKPEQLSQLKLASLARVLCDNGDNITKITDNVFHLPSHQIGGYKMCSEIPKINVATWLNCEKCSGRIDPNLPETIDPTISRQDRLSRRRRSIDKMTQNQQTKINNNHQEEIDDHDEDHEIDMFIEMNDVRIEGLETIINHFKKTLKQLRHRVQKLEATCSAKNIQSIVDIEKIDNNKKKHGHCIDKVGNIRLNNEIWSENDCTHCDCKHHQINCTTEKCSKLKCKNDQFIKQAGECCEICATNQMISN